MGVASLVNGGSGGSAPEILFNLQPNPNAFRLCCATIWHSTNAYGTKDTYYVTKETPTTYVTSCLAGAMYKA